MSKLKRESDAARRRTELHGKEFSDAFRGGGPLESSTYDDYLQSLQQMHAAQEAKKAEVKTKFREGGKYLHKVLGPYRDAGSAANYYDLVLKKLENKCCAKSCWGLLFLPIYGPNYAGIPQKMVLSDWEEMYKLHCLPLLNASNGDARKSRVLQVIKTHYKRAQGRWQPALLQSVIVCAKFFAALFVTTVKTLRDAQKLVRLPPVLFSVLART